MRGETQLKTIINLKGFYLRQKFIAFRLNVHSVIVNYIIINIIIMTIIIIIHSRVISAGEGRNEADVDHLILFRICVELRETLELL